MCRRLVIAIAVGVSLSGSTLLAQCGCGAVETGYAPMAPSYSAYYPSTVTYYSPAPQVTYAPAAPVTYYSPVTPQVTYYAPAPTYTTFYASPTVQPYATYYAPAVQPTVVYYGYAGRSVFGAPRVYVPGQPVRNVFKAITP
jgi:hypothetical protein